MSKLKKNLDTSPDEIPKNIQSLIEVDHGKFAQSTIHDTTYWVVTMEAAIIAGQGTAAAGPSAQCT